MKSPVYHFLEDSHKAAPKGKKLETLNPNELIDVTVRVRRKAEIDLKDLDNAKQMSHDEYAQKHGSSDKDFAAIEKFAAEHQLSVIERHHGRRSIFLKGRISDFEKAFKVNLAHYSDGHGTTYRGRTGMIAVPKELSEIIEGVFGLDNRPIARPMFQVAKAENGTFVAHAAVPHAFTGNQLADVYGFPAPFDGTGQTVAIIELGGGFRNTDITNYFTGLGLNVPTVSAISVDGGHNSPSTPDGADGEVMLDIEVAGAVAPKAKYAVYFAPNTDRGFLDAITTALHDTVNKPSVISISWGSAEINWTPAAMNSFNSAFSSAALLGVTICVAAGDTGSADGVADGKAHVDFPASSPYVLACGGTKCLANGNHVTSEVVWHEAADSATGGGVSEFFALPAYQNAANVPLSVNSSHFKGRGVPDVAGNADPNTGYKVLVDGQSMVIGGTSAVAPLMAGLIARCNQKNGNRAGYINPKIYANHANCRDIKTGNNKTTTTHLGYTAATGWDACTGWGVLNSI